MKHWYYSWLVPYTEGTLDARRQAQLEARLARDPALAAEAEALRRTAQRLRASAQEERDAAESGPPSSEVWPGIEARLRPIRRSAPRPWLWAGGLCAAAALGWATFWGPLTPHTAYSFKPLNPVTTVAQQTPIMDTRPSEAGHEEHRRASSHGSGKTVVKRPNRVKKSAPLPRPTHADLLADRPAMTPSATAPEMADSAPSGSGRFQLATHVGTLPEEPSDQTSMDGAAQTAPEGEEGTAKPNETPGGVAKSAGSSRGGHRKAHHRRHRRHRSTGSASPPMATPELPPDTIPQVTPASPLPKHRPDID